MARPDSRNLPHPVLTRRTAIQAGAIGLLGLGTAELSALRATAGAAGRPRSKSVIFIFLTGGISQHDSFDLKPDAPDTVRGTFRPIATRTPGIEICEHLRRRGASWSLNARSEPIATITPRPATCF